MRYVRSKLDGTLGRHPYHQSNSAQKLQIKEGRQIGAHSFCPVSVSWRATPRAAFMATPERRPAQKDTPAPEESCRQDAPTMESPESLNTRHRELRHEYRDLLENARLNKDVLTRLGSDALHLVMRRANALQQSVSRPREQAVDSELFSDLSDLGATKAAKLLRKSQGLTPEDFLAAVKIAFLPGVVGRSRWRVDSGWTAAGGLGRVVRVCGCVFPRGPSAYMHPRPHWHHTEGQIDGAEGVQETRRPCRQPGRCGVHRGWW